MTEPRKLSSMLIVDLSPYRYGARNDVIAYSIAKVISHAIQKAEGSGIEIDWSAVTITTKPMENYPAGVVRIDLRAREVSP